MKPATLVCISTVLLGLALLTLQRNVQYQSELALWQDAVTKNADNPRAHVNLAYTYEMRGEFDRATSEYHAALGLRPGLRWAEQGLLRVQLKREGGTVP
jgi:Flp pilus assembly protein TadD